MYNLFIEDPPNVGCLAWSTTVSTTILLFVGEELLKDVLSFGGTSKVALT